MPCATAPPAPSRWRPGRCRTSSHAWCLPSSSIAPAPSRGVNRTTSDRASLSTDLPAGRIRRAPAMTDVRIVTEALGGSPLSRALQQRRAPAEWTVEAPSSPAAWRARAAARGAARDWASTWRCLAPALEASGAAGERLQRVIDARGVVVTTGQQPGLFGGPIYTLSKAVSTIALADALEEATGIPTAPLFWAATDDADFAEASSTAVARQGGLEVLRSEHAPP